MVDDEDGGECGRGGGRAPATPVRAHAGSSCCKCKISPAQAVCRRQPLCSICLQAAVRGRLLRGIALPSSSGGSGNTRLLLGLSGGASGGAVAAAASFAADCVRGRRPWESVAAAYVDTEAAFESSPIALAACARARDAALAQALPRGFSVALVLVESALLPDAGSGSDEPDLLAVTISAPCTLPQTDDEVVDDSPRAVRAPLCGGAAVAAAASAAAAQLTALRKSPAAAAAAVRLRALLAAAPSPDARLRLYTVLVEAALLRAAAAFGCGDVALCDSADRMAAKLIALACAGGGLALPREALPLAVRHAALPMSSPPPPLPCEVAGEAGTEMICRIHGPPLAIRVHTTAGESLPFAWYAGAPASAPAACPANDITATAADKSASSVAAQVRVLKPAAECEAVELALFCHFAGVPTARGPALFGAGRAGGMAPVIDSFVTSLQSSYGGTVHNVTRTARKVAAVGAGDLPSACCAVCSAPLPDSGSPFSRRCEEAAARLRGVGAAPSLDVATAAAVLCFPCGELARVHAGAPLAAMAALPPSTAVAALASATEIASACEH